MSCGVAAGIAAAFRSPVGGLLFALEEVVSWWRPTLLWMVFFCTAVVSLLLRMLVDTCKQGNCGFVGSFSVAFYRINITEVEEPQLHELVPMAVVGILGGLLGSWFSWING